MNPIMRQRSQKIFQATQENLVPGIQAIASVTGVPKSSVHRHQQAIVRRNQHPESQWWETEVGSAWLKRLVCGISFFFGIKHGIGVGELCQFLKAMRLGLHVGCSPSTLANLQQDVKATIEAYKADQSKHCQPQPGQGICVGSDEVFFGLPVLVLAELASGYLLTEVECENRTYDTWKEKIQPWWEQAGWQCHFMVSDRAKALIKLAVDGLGCVSVPDLFHALRALAQPIGSAIGRQSAHLAKQGQSLREKIATTTHPAKREELEQSLTVLAAAQTALVQDQELYHEAIEALSLAIHPFHLTTQQWQLFTQLSEQLTVPLEQLRQLGQTYGGAKASRAIVCFEKQIPEITQGIHAWWRWTTQALSQETDSVDIQNWLLTVLLPWVYWLQQADKTQQPQLKARYQQASEDAAQRLMTAPLTQSLPAQERQIWIEWARWMAHNYQRTSSAIEGRNGYLTRLHHSGRGFSQQTLKVLTIIHNFHLKRPDGTTAAQRLFNYEFPDLFEWIVDHMGDLPLARRSSKSQRPDPFYLEGFPA